MTLVGSTIQQRAVEGLDPALVLEDYRTAYRSRQLSLVARDEVITGRAMFGIFGDGKEVAQVALARALRPGDIRSGYYRDQTLMLALGALDVRQFFAQLYGHVDVVAEPSSAGRSMNAHFATRMLDESGEWKALVDDFHSSADISPTAAQMPRLLGLAQASKLYRTLPELRSMTRFSRDGDEIAVGTIGNASCAEGMFWETLNAAGVMQVPMLLSVWDDGYGISVPNELQLTKGHLAELLEGFRRTPNRKGGLELMTVLGWDYPALVDTFAIAAAGVRRDHVPAVVHVVELTQPLGHSTTGSHERYKSTERLTWEKEHDCLARMRAWLITDGFASVEDLEMLERGEREYVRRERDEAWNDYQAPILAEARSLTAALKEVGAACPDGHAEFAAASAAVAACTEPLRRDLASTAHRALVAVRGCDTAAVEPLRRWVREQREASREQYDSHLYAEGADSALRVKSVAPVYGDGSGVDAHRVLNACFDAALARDPRIIAFGEDVGRLGDVNKGFAGLQARFGESRVADTGIRECTIIGQAIGLAMRGLRPIAEIQYVDYMPYALQILSDDLASLRYRTKSGQKAPVIVRTRGHRLVGVWHSGSPMAAIVHLLRGMYVLVPRDMTRAAGFYNSLLQSGDPAVVVEVLNGYYRKERMPLNIGELKTPIGRVEVIRQGKDVTVVTYGACCQVALEAADSLAATTGVSVEVIDVQSLLPFDIDCAIVESLKKTNRVLFLDEDVPGGATSYMMQEVLERQGGFHWLDAAPRTLTAAAHRPAYGRDGDYMSKPNTESVFQAVYDLMASTDPLAYPPILD